MQYLGIGRSPLSEECKQAMKRKMFEVNYGYYASGAPKVAHYETLEAAQKVCNQVFDATGVVLSIVEVLR